MSDIEARVKKIIAEHSACPNPTCPRKGVRRDLWRRLARHRGAREALEDEFGIEIPDEEAEKITTVQLAIDYAVSHQKADAMACHWSAPRASVGIRGGVSSSRDGLVSPSALGRRRWATIVAGRSASAHHGVRRLGDGFAHRREVKGFDVEGCSRPGSAPLDSSSTTRGGALRRWLSEAAARRDARRRQRAAHRLHDRLRHRWPAMIEPNYREYAERGPRRISPFRSRPRSST